ncbi:hypothetical protein L211DRAFT_844278, partial [Terfezia boudieri ATCC MYA-4762]
MKKLPIIPDAVLVDPKFGTGAVKITPAHDPNDFEFWKRHSSFAPKNEESTSLGLNSRERVPIPIVRVFGTDGKMLPSSHPDLVGMDRLHARQRVVDMIQEAGRYRGRNSHLMRVAQCSRTGCIIEPMLCPQWFLRMKPLADNVLSKGMVAGREDLAEGVGCVEEDSSEIHGSELIIRPRSYRTEWKRWLEGIQDWCLSRQIWWGHRIPAWRVIDPAFQPPMDQEVPGMQAERWVIGLTEEEARTELGPSEQHLQLVQDDDVSRNGAKITPSRLLRVEMISSSFGWHVWQCSVPGSVDNCPSGKFFFTLLSAIPWGARCQSRLETSLTLWLSWKVIRSSKSKRELKPRASHAFKSLLLCRVSFTSKTPKPQDEKLIKSKLLPKGVVESGADPLRMSLVDYMRQTRQIPFDVSRVDDFRKLAIKLLNIFKLFRYLRQSSTQPSNIEVPKSIPADLRGKLQLHDLYMLFHLRRTTKICNSAFETRTLHHATSALRTFIYDVLGNIYVMYLKPELEAGDRAREEMALRLTAFALDT